jgi:hypothetical protein
MLRVAITGAILLVVTNGGLSGGQLVQQPIQSRGQNPGAPQFPGQRPGLDEIPGIPPATEERQANARNSERQKKLMEDTNKLLALATDLKEQVDKTNKDILSVDVIKKADEIEKLAHSVKERMKS